MAEGLVDLLIPILKDISNTQYSELASSTIIVFDYLITLNQEIQFIWKAPWTIGKVLFFMNRYYTLFIVVFNNYALFSPHLTDDFCLHWFQWQGWTGLVSAALAESVLQLRLYALYYGKKKVLVLMLSFFIAAMTSSAVIMGTTLRDLTARSHLIPGKKFCVPLNVSPHFYAFWIPILAFETFLCVLACIRGYISYRRRELRLADLRRRRSRSNSQQRQPERKLNILEILLRDSVGYFIIIFATYITTTMIWIFGTVTVIEIPLGFTVALSSVIANRLLLNLRSSHKHSISASTTSINTNANPTSPNQYLSSQSISINGGTGTGTGTMRHGTSTIELDSGDREDGRFGGSELTGYELEVLRELKASP